MVVRQSDSGRKVEIGIWHLFVFALSRILKKRGKRRKTKKTRENLGLFDRHLLRPEHLEAPIGIGPMIKVLQTSALPLGYGAVCSADAPSVYHMKNHLSMANSKFFLIFLKF